MSVDKISESGVGVGSMTQRLFHFLLLKPPSSFVLTKPSTVIRPRLTCYRRNMSGPSPIPPWLHDVYEHSHLQTVILTLAKRERSRDGARAQSRRRSSGSKKDRVSSSLNTVFLAAPSSTSDKTNHYSVAVGNLRENQPGQSHPPHFPTEVSTHFSQGTVIYNSSRTTARVSSSERATLDSSSKVERTRTKAGT